MATIPQGQPQGLTPAQLNASETAQWKQILRQALTGARFASVAFLAADVDPTAQTVVVQIAIQERVRTALGAKWWDVPPIVNVPIVVPRGGGFCVTLPLKKGDEGLLVFCDTCFDNWWVSGQSNAPPADNLKELGLTGATGSQRQFEVRRHWVHDCGFIPGMWSQPNTLANYSTDSLQVRADDGSAVIDVSSGSIKLTSTTTVEVHAPVINADDGGTPLALMTAAWQTWFTVNVLPHITTGVIPPPPSTTTILKGE